MTRHGKNATANSVYTYHERKKDSAASGWGSLRQRLSKDAIKGFDCCSLTLQPCRDPMVTPDGHLYDKCAILEYILHQKKDNALKLKEWQKHQEQELAKQEEEVSSERQAKLEKFVENQSTPVIHSYNEGSEESLAAGSSTANGPSVSNMAGKRKHEMPSFWTPDQLPTAKKSRLCSKPDQKVYCPMSGMPLKMKDLIPVKFTKLPSDDKRADVAKQVRYMCAISNDELTNSIPTAVLRSSGSVVTMEAVDKIVKKDWSDPTVGCNITEADIITLQRGGTGYSSTNTGLDSKLARPAQLLA